MSIWQQMAKPFSFAPLLHFEAAYRPGCSWKRNGEVHGRFAAFHLPLGAVQMPKRRSFRC
jgi:hypothetical protein